MCTLCAHISIFMLSLSLRMCVHVDITNICSYHAETSDRPATQRSLCRSFPFLTWNLFDSKMPGKSHYPTYIYYFSVLFQEPFFFFPSLSLEIKYFLYLKWLGLCRTQLTFFHLPTRDTNLRSLSFGFTVYNQNTVFQSHLVSLSLSSLFQRGSVLPIAQLVHLLQCFYLCI